MNVVKLFEHYKINLIKDGIDRFRVVCPFHKDTNPSLVVYNKTNTWWCFGCSLGTTVLDFVMLKERCSYNEALFIVTNLQQTNVIKLKKRVDALKSCSEKVNIDFIRLRFNNLCRKFLRSKKTNYVNKLTKSCDEGRNINKVIEILKYNV